MRRRPSETERRTRDQGISLSRVGPVSVTGDKYHLYYKSSYYMGNERILLWLLYVLEGYVKTFSVVF